MAKRAPAGAMAMLEERQRAARRRIVGAMTKPQRRTYLVARGWQRLTGGGGETWRAPAPDDRAVYTLAAATQLALARERRGGGG
jgi:hypothetical protein